MSASVLVTHRFRCPVACEIFLDQGLNPCLLHWQADSLPLRYQGSPLHSIFFFFLINTGTNELVFMGSLGDSWLRFGSRRGGDGIKKKLEVSRKSCSRAR